MRIKHLATCVCLLGVFSLAVCSKPEGQTVEEIKHYSVDNLDIIL